MNSVNSQSSVEVNLTPTPVGQRIHHTGFVVASISAVLESFCRSIRGNGWSQTWHDPKQRVRVAFIYPSHPDEPSIELVEPADRGSPVEKFLEHGGGLHHLCYEFSNFDEAVGSASAQGLVLVRRPQPAIAFGGRRIAWFQSRERLLIEYLEKA
jgi:methylmalonyl-CoA/ethylmalonyl-CoA epimerase